MLVLSKANKVSTTDGGLQKTTKWVKDCALWKYFTIHLEVSLIYFFLIFITSFYKIYFLNFILITIFYLLFNFVAQVKYEWHLLRLRLNWLQTDSGNDFPENGGVWLLLQIRSNWKAFPVDQIWEPKQRQWFSVSIFTSNYFRRWKIDERERERERERIDRDITVRRHHWLAR